MVIVILDCFVRCNATFTTWKHLHRSLDSMVAPELVDIGTHNLALYTHEELPRTSRHQSFSSSGGSPNLRVLGACTEWLPQNLLAYTYDCLGHRNSDRPQSQPTA